ncbi:asparagine synthetase B, partial [Candidatus Woesearchaeota archaeon]|nr:asparagine synthetase B [Candidatus Woesearchaeota archaeon]
NNLTDVVRINENETGGKKKKYFQKTNDGKQILRNVMKNYVPNSIVKGQKQGFSSPDASWFKGESIDFVKTKLFNGHTPLYDYLDRDSVEKLVNQHLDGDVNRRLFIWSLLNFEECCHIYE